MSEDEVIRWVTQLARGDTQAAQPLWNRYYGQLVRLARTKLGSTDRRIADEEDIALSAFNSFCRGLAADRFPDLSDRHDLWRLLITLTARKAAAHLRRMHSKKRGAGMVRGESVFQQNDPSGSDIGIAAVLGKEPSPEFAAQLSEEVSRLLDCLKDETLRAVALSKLQGYNNAEIADQLHCAPCTVGRKLERIRQKWSKEER